MHTAVYPGSFDPIHYGHIDIALRAAQLFDGLIVGVYDRPRKSVLFSTQERVALVRHALEGNDAIQVCSYTGLTVEFVRRMNSRIIVRGLRAMYDFELEYQTAMISRRLAPDVDMVCLMTSLDHAFISSTVVKDVARAGGPLDGFVPDVVARALEERLGPGERSADA